MYQFLIIAYLFTLKLPAKCCSVSVPKHVSDAGLNFVKCFPNECLNIYKDFDETFVAFPNAVANRHCRIHKELSENEEVILLDTDTEITETDSQLYVALKSNDSLDGTLQVSNKDLLKNVPLIELLIMITS